MEDNTKQNLIPIECYLHFTEYGEIQIPKEELTPEIELRNFIKKLSPVAVGHDLIRIGEDGDGGYLVPDDLEGIRVCFSAGYGGHTKISFERMLYTHYDMKIFIVDILSTKERIFRTLLKPIIEITRTIRRMGSPDKCYFWDCIVEDKLLGIQNTKGTIRLDDWIKKYDNHHTKDDLILQMDIEYAEWSILRDMSSETLKRFRIIIIEFHSMSKVFRQPFFMEVKHVFEKILNDFVVVHIHPNNSREKVCFCREQNYRDIEICEIMEFTFIRKDRVIEDNRSLVFPHKLDHRNIRCEPDLVLPKIWQG